MRGNWLASLAFEQVSAHFAGSDFNAICRSMTLCHLAGVLSGTSNLVRATFQDRYPSPARPGPLRTRPTTAVRNRRKSPTGNNLTKKSVEFTLDWVESGACKELNKELAQCLKLPGFSPLRLSSLSRLAKPTTSSVASSVQPLAQPSPTQPALTAPLARSSAQLSARPATTSALADPRPRTPLKLAKLKNRRVGRRACAAVLHSKDPCTCSRRS